MFSLKETWQLAVQICPRDRIAERSNGHKYLRDGYLMAVVVVVIAVADGHSHYLFHLPLPLSRLYRAENRQRQRKFVAYFCDHPVFFLSVSFYVFLRDSIVQ